MLGYVLPSRCHGRKKSQPDVNSLFLNLVSTSGSEICLSTYKTHRSSSSSNSSGLFAFYCCTMSFFISLYRLSILLRLIFYFPVFLWNSQVDFYLLWPFVAVCFHSMLMMQTFAAIFSSFRPLFFAMYFYMFYRAPLSMRVYV